MNDFNQFKVSIKLQMKVSVSSYEYVIAGVECEDRVEGGVSTVANLNQARKQMEGKNLADLQDDYHKLAKKFYSAKIQRVR